MNILIIDDKVPDPSFCAGFPRAYMILISLIELGHRIHFYPNVKESIKKLDIEKLKEYNIHVCSDLSVLPKDIDVIIVSRPHNTHYHLPIAKEYVPTAKIIYDTEALWYRRYDLQMSITGKLPSWAYRYDEIGMSLKADLCFVVNDIEKKILKEKGANVKILAHALEPEDYGKPFSERKDILIIGGILEENSSNEDALWQYLINCWTQVQEKLNCQINVTGNSHTKRLLEAKNINLLGHVDDLKPLYASHKISVAATRFATGIPWKVHEAMANGLPCVISKLLAEQLNINWDQDALVATNWQEFIEKSIELYTNENLWNTIRTNGFNLIKKDCDIDNFKQILQTSLEELFS